MTITEAAIEVGKAFLVGGGICALVQILLDRTKMMPGRVMVLLVVLGSILGFLEFISPLRSGRVREPGCRFSDLEIHSGRE